MAGGGEGVRNGYHVFRDLPLMLVFFCPAMKMTKDEIIQLLPTCSWMMVRAALFLVRRRM